MNRPSHILVYAPSGLPFVGALRRAARLATSDTRLTLVDVVPELTTLARAVLPRDLHDVYAREREAELRHDIPPLDGVHHVPVRVLTGSPAPAIVRMVIEQKVDLLLKVSSGATDENPLDALDMKLLRKCPCPVWITPGGRSGPLTRVLAAIDPFASDDGRDGSLNRTILDHAVMAAATEDASVSVVHAWDVVGERLLRRHVSADDVDRMLSEHRRQAHEAVQRAVEPFAGAVRESDILLMRGEAPTAIQRAAESVHADLIVMGTVARTGVPGLIMGNTAELVLRSVTCEVLTVKPAGFVSPLAPRDTVPVVVA